MPNSNAPVVDPSIKQPLPDVGRIYNRFDHIQVGDRVAIEGRGPCTGGASFGHTHRVIEVTTTEIVTEEGRYSRDNGEATCKPWAYYIEWWTQGELQNQE